MLMQSPAELGAQAKPLISRLKSKIHGYRWPLLLVALPILVATVYYSTMASDVYVSESQFAIKSPGQQRLPSSPLAGLFGSSAFSSGAEQANEVISYLQSRDGLNDLQRTTRVRAMYENNAADVLSRFPKPFAESSFENFYRYFESRISAGVNADTNVVVLQVQAFTPQDAQTINERLLEQSEALVNRLNNRAQTQIIQENQRQVEEAARRLSVARIALQRYRNSKRILDPTEQAAGVLQISNSLVAERAALEAQLQTTERVAPKHPALPALRQRISALSAQIAMQEGKAVGTKDGIASKLTEYERLLAEQGFATEMLNAANATLEQSRAEAQKQQFYLERVVQPNKPDMPTLPHRLRTILTIAGTVICLYLIGWMLIVGILEHSPDE